jgi:hypothetical protein
VPVVIVQFRHAICCRLTYVRIRVSEKLLDDGHGRLDKFSYVDVRHGSQGECPYQGVVVLHVLREDEHVHTAQRGHSRY